MGTNTLHNLYLKNYKINTKKTDQPLKRELKFDDAPMLHREALLKWLLYP